MKKLTLLFTLMSVALTLQADPIIRAKAMQLAQEFMVPGYQMSLAIEAPTRRAAAATATEATAPYYVISRGENQGYVIIAGDDCLPEVLGYTDHGNFDASNLPPALQEMLDTWQNIVETTQANGTNVALAAERKAARRAASSRVDIAPFVTSHWGQGAPYNNHCPTITSNGNRALTGCVATAASQILYYWRKDLPATLQAATPTYGYGDAPVTRSVPKGTPMKWDLMLDKYGSEPQEFKDAVAEFVFATGAATWLTYGSSTSGNIEKIPYTFSAYFGMNGGTVHYRNSYSQESWTQLLYNELAQKRPVMYTGVHPDQGGHAVFIHGYKASNDTFYFNFGWDGANDGYYTTTTTDGMNGFFDSQSALIGAYPKAWNLAVDIVPPLHVYTNVDNRFTIKITNNSTLPFSGIYLFSETSATKPSDLSKAKSKNTDTEIAVDGSAEVVLTAKPTREQAYYITATDANLNILARIQVTPEKAESDLHLNAITLDASSDTETLDNENFQVIYNDQSKAYASIANHSDIGYSGSFRMDFYVYDEEKKEWTLNLTRSNQIDIDAHSNGIASFNITSGYFEAGKKYMAHLQDQTVATDVVHIGADTPNTLRFILKGNVAMTDVSFEDNCLTLKGDFDNTAFNTSAFANKRAYKTATIYDLTQCNAVNIVTQSVNPNALIYVADYSQAQGTNIIRAGHCDLLSLIPGYSFTPRSNFTAAEAEIQIGTEPHIWYWLTIPFTMNVPDGIIARQIKGHSQTIITSSNIETVKQLEAGKTYLLMASSSNALTLKASNVTVLAQPTSNTDEAIVGTYANTTTPEGAMLLNYSEQPYIQPVEAGCDVEGFRAYWYDVNTTKQLRAYLTGTIETAHLELARSIEQAYDMLNYQGELMSDEDRAILLTKIHEAEHEFSNRADGETTLTNATLVKKYAAQLLADGEAFIRKGKLANGLEVDFTENITNPSFEATRPTARGWTLGTKEGVSTTGTVLQANLNNVSRTVGIEGTNVFRSYIAADNSSVSISQTVTGLTPGHYRLRAMLGTDIDRTVTLFADEATTTVNGHPFGTYYLTEAVIEDVTVMPDENEETGSLTIGVKEGDWYKADDFRLIYIGTLTEEEQATGIFGIATEEKGNRRQGIFTLQGIEVKTAQQPGLYIIDGKKTYVK